MADKQNELFEKTRREVQAEIGHENTARVTDLRMKEWTINEKARQATEQWMA